MAQRGGQKSQSGVRTRLYTQQMSTRGSPSPESDKEDQFTFERDNKQHLMGP